jgi:hypothetical protein
MSNIIKKYFENMSDRDIMSAKNYNNNFKVDSFVEAVKKKYDERSLTGIKKYNTTLERDDLSLVEWLTHLQEELMDATLYVEKLKSEFGDKLRKG